ncbi:MAG: hypothetical protein HZB46_09820 [Solirubrobacterales bacterium]|nr:hypothetical protein [Solirubrobacterales bacterium]
MAAGTHQEAVEAILAAARAQHALLLGQVSPGLQASLPVDATGITHAIARIAEATGRGDEVAAELAARHRANPAVLHGRVFGRAPLSTGTVLAAFVEGARVRADVLLELAEAAGGTELGEEVRALLVAAPPPVDAGVPGAADALRATYAAQERAAVRIAAALDAR